MEVRFCDKSDVKRLAYLLDAFNKEFNTPSLALDILEENILRLMENGCTWIIVIGRPIVSFAIISFSDNVWFDEPIALLDEFYTVPEERNKELGHRIISFAEAKLKEVGIKEFKVEVDEADIDAMRFYQRHGWDNPIDQDQRSFMIYKEL